MEPATVRETPLNELMGDLETLEKYFELDVDISVITEDYEKAKIETHPRLLETVTRAAQTFSFSEMMDQLNELEKFTILSTRDEKKRLQYNEGLKFIATTMIPTSLEEMVAAVKHLLKYHSGDTENPTKRVLNFLYLILGGPNTLSSESHPETRTCAAILTQLPASDRHNYFTRFFKEFSDRLTSAHRERLTEDLSNIEFASKSPTHADPLASYARMILGHDIASFLRELT